MHSLRKGEKTCHAATKSVHPIPTCSRGPNEMRSHPPLRQPTLLSRGDRAPKTYFSQNPYRGYQLQFPPRMLTWKWRPAGRPQTPKRGLPRPRRVALGGSQSGERGDDNGIAQVQTGPPEATASGARGISPSSLGDSASLGDKSASRRTAGKRCT
jgi:hypothetical protein